ncbi:MAPK regulated corepressor interacting protein 2 [Nymphon striatum]|nr:MAPK regulated corepressor interacting protein 2 [Nymphon striatum]
MYTLSKGPSSKIVAKTRRGFSQGNLESQRELINSKKSTPGNLKEQPNSTEMSSPKPIFQSANGKRSAASRVPPPEAMSPQHEEMVKFVSTAWNEVCREYEMSKPEPRAQEEHEGTVIRGVKYYEETEPNPALDSM